MRLRRFLFGGSLKKMTREQWEYLGWAALISTATGAVTTFVLDRLA